MGKRSILVVLGVIGFSIQGAWAEEGTAGCGLGSRIFTRNTIISQTFAGGTNYASSQPSSITSGTSGCKTNGFVKLDRQKIYYAERNYDELSVDMAKGHGETLSGFAQLFGCSDAGVEAFGRMSKAKYQDLFPADHAGPAVLLKSVKEEISKDQFLTKDCVLRT